MDVIKELLFATEKVYNRISVTEIAWKSERELKRLILSEYKTRLCAFSFKGDIVAGARSSVGEGDATDYIIKRATQLFWTFCL